MASSPALISDKNCKICSEHSKVSSNLIKLYLSDNPSENFLEMEIIELFEDKKSFPIWAEHTPNIHSGQKLDTIKPIKFNKAKN